MQGNLKGSAMGTLCFLFLWLNLSDTTSYRHYVEILLKFNFFNSYLSFVLHFRYFEKHQAHPYQVNENDKRW